MPLDHGRATDFSKFVRPLSDVVCAFVVTARTTVYFVGTRPEQGILRLVVSRFSVVDCQSLQFALQFWKTIDVKYIIAWFFLSRNTYIFLYVVRGARLPTSDKNVRDEFAVVFSHSYNNNIYLNK